MKSILSKKVESSEDRLLCNEEMPEFLALANDRQCPEDESLSWKWWFVTSSTESDAMSVVPSLKMLGGYPNSMLGDGNKHENYFNSDSITESQSIQGEPLSLEDMELSRHVMYDWSQLGLGDRTGSGAWNAALRTRLIRSRCDTIVPQLSSIECLARIQQELNLTTILPPRDSLFLSQQESLDGEIDTTTQSQQQDLVRHLYRFMVLQDLDDGRAFRRDLRFTCTQELVSRMQRAENEMSILAARETAIRRKLGEKLW